MSERRQFIAEVAAFFPALYEHQQRLHDHNRQDAQRRILQLARIARVEGLDCKKLFCILLANNALESQT